MVTHMVIQEAGDRARILVKCRVCGQEHSLLTSESGYQQWIDGELIQRAMPELKPNDRELLISGTCSGCWARHVSDPNRN